MSEIPSPCVAVCQIDPANGYCLGCWRTIEEIAGWSGFDEQSRRQIIAELHGRRGAAAPRQRRVNRRKAALTTFAE